MRCDEARQLLNAHLDGELAGSLAAEFHAHRLQCAACRRQLALLEVTGHLLGTSAEPAELRADFTDRLLACVETRKRGWRFRMQRIAYIGVPLAAAAMIALAFLGVFDRGRDSKVAGLKVLERPASVAADPTLRPKVSGPSELDLQASQRAVDEWIVNTRKNVQRKQESSQSLQKAFDLTILQVLGILEEINDRSVLVPVYPGADDEPAAPPAASDDDETDADVEDL